MSTETSAQSRGGLKRHTKLRRGSVNHGARQSLAANYIAPAPPPLREMLVHCACGCGAEINIAGRRIAELRAQGRTYKSIAAEWDRTPAQIKFYFARPVRYVNGHATRGGKWVDGACSRCGAPLKVAPYQIKPPVCWGRKGCSTGPLDLEANRTRYDNDLERRLAAERAVRGDLLARVHATRPLRNPPRRHWRTVQGDNRRLFDLELESAVNGASPELLALIEEQRTEARREKGQLARFMRSLDEPLRTGGNMGGNTRTLYDRIDAAHNRHTLAFARPTEDMALDNVAEWESVREAMSA